MNRVTLATFLAAVAVLVAALLTGNTLVSGGSGVVMLVGVIYSYVVTLREIERSHGE